MSDDLIARAKENSEGFVVPDHWGDVVELEVDPEDYLAFARPA